MTASATIRRIMADRSSSRSRNVVGVMTGTSIDGIDAALVRIDGTGLGMRISLVQHLSASLGGLQERLRAAASQQAMTAGLFARLAWDFGVLHAEVIGSLSPSRDKGVNLICIHGQTVFHQPSISWQLVNPAPIAARFDCPIVSDLRQADLARGGQGAPITPIADWILFRDREHQKKRAIINLGGFCNVTIVPAAPVNEASVDETLHASLSPAAGGNPRTATVATDATSAIAGFDVCVCNQLLDAIAREALDMKFDEHGAAAARGRPEPQAVRALREILERQRREGRSLGTGDEALAWLTSHRSHIKPDDLAASAVEAIAQTIAAAAREHAADELILAGGGARNVALREALARAAGVRAILSDDLGIPVDAREATCFAILGALCQDGVPITLPQVTGCREPAPISGVWTNLSSGRCLKADAD